MTGKRFHIVWLLGLVLFMTGCGNDAPPDAVISAVEDDITTEISNSAGGTLVAGAIHFKVAASAEDPSPVADATVNIFGSSPILGDPLAGFVANLLGGVPLNPTDPNHLVRLTDASGVVTVYYQFSIPACTSTGDITATASISASIGGSTALWKDETTIKSC